MDMSRFKIKGGYGEHGRSCFLVEYGDEGHYYMVDCGIMDTDSAPCPDIVEEEARAIDYLFLTHCHKDHTGAFSFLVELGFQGIVVSSALTLKLAHIHYNRIRLLSLEDGQSLTLPGLKVFWGRSGHCPGAVWFQIQEDEKNILFSGDYQENALSYACDAIRNRTVDLAVIDCAHNTTRLDAEALRARLWQGIKNHILEQKSLILPVPQYGRGLELLLFLQQKIAAHEETTATKGIAEVSLCVDTNFMHCISETITQDYWYREKPDMSSVRVVSVKKGNVSCETPFVLLIADTHLRKKENRNYVKKAVKHGAKVLITGRVRKGSFCRKLLIYKKAERYLYPHHQSAGDLENMLAQNHFKLVLPYHNDEQQVILCNGKSALATQREGMIQ